MDNANNERVGKGLAQLKLGLLPFVSNGFIASYREQGKTWRILPDLESITSTTLDPKRPFRDMDAAALLRVMWVSWNEVFRNTLGPVERSLISELRAARNNWAHQKPFSDENAYRALDSICRLLAAINSPQAQIVERLKEEQLRILAGLPPQPEKAEQQPVPAGDRQTTQAKAATSTPSTAISDAALFRVNFDPTRITLHRSQCRYTQGFTAQKSDPKYGWQEFDSYNTAMAALGERKFHACRVCNP